MYSIECALLVLSVCAEIVTHRFPGPRACFFPFSVMVVFVAYTLQLDHEDRKETTVLFGSVEVYLLLFGLHCGASFLSA